MEEALMKYTVRDPMKMHQVVLFTKSGNVGIFVSCNCLRKNLKTEAYTAIGQTHEFADTVRLYNEASSHAKPFSKEDELTWRPAPRRVPLVSRRAAQK